MHSLTRSRSCTSLGVALTNADVLGVDVDEWVYPSLAAVFALAVAVLARWGNGDE